jgi:hypothetical protein
MAVDHFVKQKNIWTIREVEQEIKLVSFSCILTLAEIYDRVEFKTQSEE